MKSVFLKKNSKDDMKTDRYDYSKKIRKTLGLRRLYCPYPLPWFKIISKENEMNFLHRLAFAESPKEKSRFKVLSYYFKWPLCAFTQATEHMLLKRKKVKSLYGIGTMKMWRESFYYALFYNIPLNLYYDYNLWEPVRKKHVLSLIHNHEMLLIFARLYKDQDTSHINNKNKFHQLCKKFQLPTTTPVAVFNSGKCEPFSDLLPKKDLFSKNSKGNQGEACSLWKYEQNSDQWSYQDHRFNEEDLLNFLCRESLKADLVLQVAEKLHPKLKKFSNGALNTLRVTTYKLPKQDPVILFCSFRMPIGDAIVDNVSVSGVAACVNKEGVMESAVGKDLFLGKVLSHPDTGAPICGERLPFYEEMTELALNAHKDIETPTNLGWDITYTETGLKIIEANTRWCVEKVQLSCEIPLLDLKFIELIKHDLGLN